jgi:hypothetical protein
LPVATTTQVVPAGCSTASQRHRVRATTIPVRANSTAQPTCIDGIAAYWLSRPVLAGSGPYTDWPKRTPVSITPKSGRIRGGISGYAAWPTSASAVVSTSTRRNHR